MRTSLMRVAWRSTLGPTQEPVPHILGRALTACDVRSRLKAVHPGETLDCGRAGHAMRLTASDSVSRVRGGTRPALVPTPGGRLVAASYAGETGVRAAVVNICKENRHKYR